MKALGAYKTQCDIWKSDAETYKDGFQQCLEKTCSPAFYQTPLGISGIVFISLVVGFSLGQGR